VVEPGFAALMSETGGMTHLAPAVDYWFMLPACVIIASVAVFAGISGGTMLLPLFFLVFPTFGVPALSLPQAVGAALALQAATFGLAVFRYARRGLVRWDIVRRVALVSVPAALIGAIAAPRVPLSIFRLLFAAGLIAIAPLLWRRRGRGAQQPFDDRISPGQIVLAGGVGGLFTGIVSAGVGEATVPILSRRGLALPLVAATATVLVAATAGAATVATAARLASAGTLGSLAWPVIAWGAPGAVLGQELAVRSQGRIPEHPVRVFCGALFLVIAAAFIALAVR
jgi:uncharacterized membrane protein YfcA